MLERREAVRGTVAQIVKLERQLQLAREVLREQADALQELAKR